MPALSALAVPDNRYVRDWDAPRALGDRMRRSNRQALPCGPRSAPQLILCGTPGLDCDQSCIVCPLIRPSVGERLSEFGNLTKLVSQTRYFLSSEPYTSRRNAPKPESGAFAFMDEEYAGRRRRTFRWPKEARELVRVHLNAQRAQPRGQNSDNEVRVLVTKLVEVSRNPRDACWRFMRQSGIAGRRAYRQWPLPRHCAFGPRKSSDG